MKIRSIGIMATALALVACSAPAVREGDKGHLTSTNVTTPTVDIPPPVQTPINVPRPRPAAKAETYSVVVNNVAARDLLFALARDAKLNIDIHPDIRGTVTLNAIDQTVPQLLNRIAKQVDMRFELDGPNLAVMPDSPFLRHYKVDYVNLSRNVSGTVSANTQIATSTGIAGATGGGGGAGNVSSTRIENASKNQFWESLEKNVKDILRETDKILPEGSSETTVEQSSHQNATGAAALPQSTGQKAAAAVANALAANPSAASTTQAGGSTVVRRTTFREAASVILNPETGTLTVRATGRQHEKVQEFLDRVINAARRQVMIEATIVEVELGNGHEQGIDWTRLIGSGRFSLTSASVNSAATNAIEPFRMTFVGNTVGTAIRLLDSFGTTKVLSSPRLSVLNNQTALLKVVENVVYFNIKADTTQSVNNSLTTVTTTPQSVSVGLVLTVTPQISDSDAIILNVRPSISSISAFKEDPNPAIPVGIQNLVPQIRTREIESVMRVGNGEIAVLGGLMEDSVDYKNGRIPVLGQLPGLGELVTTRANNVRKSELVIFLRPVVIKEASLTGDYAPLKGLLPDRDFFTPPREAAAFGRTPTADRP